MNTLIVINPNSSQQVTDGINAAIDPLRSFGVPIRCLTLAEGPPAIESQKQADMTIAPMLRLAAAQTDAAGFVIACFGDPGLHALRDQTAQPVVGIQEASVMTALTLGQRVGVISILPGSIPRHMRAFGAMGVMDRIAADRALGIGVADLADPGKSRDAMIATGKRLRDNDGADVLIMGCAGMAHYRRPLHQATGLPVVDPSQAAVSLALGQIRLDLSHKHQRSDHA
ncbi:MAG: aspartate/glutamate racemase family protein [Rhodobacteraceae bacterium]|nr:aspartate/glutamate racemase family protein [Paracoccaceae bacterium]